MAAAGVANERHTSFGTKDSELDEKYFLLLLYAEEYIIRELLTTCYSMNLPN